jgi:hypothetical protein
MEDIEKYLTDDQKAQPEDERMRVLRFVAKMKKLATLIGRSDFYLYFYLSCIDDFSPSVNIMAMSYKDLTSFSIPKIVHGRNLVPFIEEILEKHPNIANEFVKKVESSQRISPETRELLKRYYVFREIVKHEIIHYINMHLPRIIEFFKKKGFAVLPNDILEAANIQADSICNIYLDEKIVEAGGLVPPLPHEVKLEELLEKIDTRNPKKQPTQKPQQQSGFGQQQDQGDSEGQGGGGGQEKDRSKGKGEGGSGGEKGHEKGKRKPEGGGGERGDEKGKEKPGGGVAGGEAGEGEEQESSIAEKYGQYKDLLPEEVEEIEKHDIDHIKDTLRKMLEDTIEKYNKSSKGIGTVPSEIEEAIKWLKKRTVKHKLVGEGDIYGIFKDVAPTYMAYNPLNENPYGIIYRSYRPLMGSAVVVIVDTSASMDSNRLSYALDIINSVVTQAETYLVEIDAKIQRVSKVGQIKNEFTFKGRGGTEFDDLERLPQLLPAREVRACIILTDGRVYSFPKVNPIPQARWIGITTDVIPENSPKWIQWMKVEEVVKDEEDNK